MISTPFTPDLVRGVAELETVARGVTPHRLPAWVGRQFPDPQLLSMQAQPSGVCLTFETAATVIELVTHPSRVAYRGFDRPRGRIDVVVDGVLRRRDELAGGDSVEVDLQTGGSTALAGGMHTTRVVELGTGSKVVEIWLPHNEALDLVELRTDAPITPRTDRRRRWVHHGSSISQGSNAVAPTEIWPVAAARAAGGIELRNLGLGGSAQVDPFLARVIRDAPADLISVKLGINVVNLDGFRLRTFVPAVHGFLDTIRDGHPDTPLLVVSPIFCGIHESTPGPGAFDPTSFTTGRVRFVATGSPADVARGSLTLEVIRDALRAVVETRSDDPHLHYLDGLDLYGAADAEVLPLPDALHPDAEAHALIARRFVERAFGRGAPFGR
ncbi:GDSL-like lipase/acylhydrolase family protein [Microbacterium sp. AG1240]|uniref:GDSL-type esterase/lipase family protein n=1 Tax=Microbacterium sp. AG1240 TaxID=2183992 RepID=UPI000EAE93D9|nr:GDSL-type esterase/lipase family protein [Microbacterium sp. AG1240]RKT33293.1 GDSL-like lipase/acylhydrolase family protein [Microbacterium sp. AG1240]